MFGWLCNTAYSESLTGSPISGNPENHSQYTSYGLSGNERISPHDWIVENEIYVFDDRVIIDIDNAKWATFTDTNSMDPVLDYGANAIQIVPESEDDIHIGDIVAYRSELTDAHIIHRVIDIGSDDLGKYYIMKGDNNTKVDPEKVRFKQINRIVVAIIY
jgi:hypothetical protein